MGTGLEIAALAASVGGTIMQQQAASDAADKQQRIINQAAEATANKNEQKNNIIQNFASETYNPADRLQSYEDTATKREGGLLDALLSANGGEGEIKSSAEGNVSGDYLRDKARATTSAASDIANRAKLMARNGAGGLMLNNESLKGGQLSSDVAGINSSINGINRGAQNDINRASNKGSLLGGLLQAGAPAIANYKR